MEFGKYLGKGLWGLADKSLPVAYGLGYVVLVIRVLPEEEFGNFVLIQEIFLIISGLAGAFALQPLLKYASEDAQDTSGVVSTTFLLNLGFVLCSSFLIILIRIPISSLLNSATLAPLLLYVPAMLAASLLRNFTLVLLQAKFLIKQVFWVDAAHFVGAPFLVWVYSRMHLFDSALDLININIISLSVSSFAGLYATRSIMKISLSPRMSEIKKVWKYASYSLGGIVSYLVYSKADTFILSAFTGPVQVAVYNSVKVFTRAFEMVSQVVQMFVLPATSRLSSRGDFPSLKALVEKATMFGTVSMLPVFILFLLGPTLLISLLYTGRYTEAVPILQVFSLLSFVVPFIAVGSNTLLGLGKVKLSFVVGLQVLTASVVCYFAFIPWFGALGAAWGYVAASYATGWLTWIALNRFVPITATNVLRRANDIRVFLRSRLR